MTGEEAADIIVRLDAGWTDRWDATRVDLWLEELRELDARDANDAVTELFRTSEKLPSFAKLRDYCDGIARRRAPSTLPTHRCIRCHTRPAEPGHTRCTDCQTIVDNEGAASSAMAAAVAAAHQLRGP